MDKKLYLLVLIFLTVNFFDIQPFGRLFAMFSGTFGLAIIAFWMLIGFYIYKEDSDHTLCNNLYLKQLKWIFIGIFLSMIPAYVFYGQSLIQSVICYRVQYFWMFILLLLYIKPTTSEIITPLLRFSILFVLLALVRSYSIFPDLFYLSEQTKDMLYRNPQMVGEDMVFGAGIGLILIPTYYYTERLRNDFNIHNLIVVLLFLISLIILQNRSSLFIALIIITYSFLSTKAKYKVPFLFFSAFISFVVLFFSYSLLDSLVDETITQLNDEDYNRVKAFNYFLFEANKNPITLIFGNGFLSAYSTSQMQDLMELGIFNADVGFLGYWNQFGIIPIFAFFYSIIYTLRSKKHTFFVKAVGFHILACSLTISYFGFIENILWYSIFYYFVVYQKYYHDIS